MCQKRVGVLSAWLRVVAASALVIAWASAASAANLVVDDVAVSLLVVNGGADATNVGTSCFQISVAPSSACTGGWIAVRNNNRQLLATLLQAKGAAARTMLWYNDAAGSNHCPWLAFTPCVLDSVALK